MSMWLLPFVTVAACISFATKYIKGYYGHFPKVATACLVLVLVVSIA